MTRIWMVRLLRGTLAGLLVGAVVGGFETGIALRGPITEVVNALQRLQLWALNSLMLAAVSGGVALVLAGAIGSFAGHTHEARTLAVETGRDPRHPWLPWVLGGALFAALMIEVLPRAESLGGGGRALMLYALAAIASAAFAVALRLWLKRVDTTGQGAGLALLGLPTLLVISMSLSVSASQAGGKGEVVATHEGVPNVLLITVDGLRADHAFGGRVRTPTLRWLARKGVSFTQATTSSTADAPSVASLLTGKHPLASGVLADGQRLPARDPATGREMPTLAEKFAEEGYATGAFVSSSALDGRTSGLSRGFEVYDDGIGTRRRGWRRLAAPTLLRWWRSSGGRTPEGTTVLRPSAESLMRFEYWLAWHYRENLFGWVHIADPRMPHLYAEIDPSNDLIDPLPGDAGRSHGSRVVQLDTILGELFKALEEDKLLSRTLVVIVGTRGYVAEGRPNVDEAWTHVPVLMYGPGLEGGLAFDQQIRLEDLPATILSAAGFRRGSMGDGRSLVPMMEGRDVDPARAITVGPPRGDGRCAIAVRTPERKLVREPGGRQAWYELDSDPKELRDRFEQSTDEVEAVGRELSDLLGREVPLAVVPALDPGTAAELRALDVVR